MSRSDGAAGCPGEAEMAVRVPQANDVEVTFGREGATYTATLRVRGSASERRLVDAGPTCDALADAAVVTAALLADELEHARSNRAAARADAAVAPEERPATLAAAPEQVPAPAKPRVDRLRMRGGVGVALGVLNHAAPMAFAGFEWSRRRLSLGLEGSWIPTQSLALGRGSVDVSLLAGSIAACATPLGRESSILVGACLAPSVGALNARGMGFASSSTATRPWVALSAFALARGPIVGPLAWEARAGAAAPLSREGFSIDHVGTAYTPPAVAWLGGAAVAMTIW